MMLQGTRCDRNPAWERTFRIQGYHRLRLAFLVFNLRHLTYVDATVRINDQEIGVIHHRDNWRVFRDHWFTQVISIGSGVIKSGEN